MSKINLHDKFFHSPNWDEKNSQGYLDRLRVILETGYILSSKKSGVVSVYDDEEGYKRDKIYLSIHPNGVFSSKYCSGDDWITGYQMTTKGFYFILDSKLSDDYSVERGLFKYECTVSNEIELYKYLVGIGNAGLSIDNDLMLCYYLIKYVNGEISMDDIINYVRERKPGVCLDIAVNLAINKSFTETLGKALSKNEESFIDVGDYYHIADILKQMGIKIDLYDNFGESLIGEYPIKEVQSILEYIATNKDILYRKGTMGILENLYSYVYQQKSTNKS